MTQAYAIHPDRIRPRVRPLKAWGHMRALLKDNEATDQVFHIIGALNGNTLERNFKRFARTDKGKACLKARRDLPAILDDHETLLQLPVGTLGRAYVDFMRREGLTAGGLVEESEKWSDSENVERFDDDLDFYAYRLRDTHDMTHILTGYGRDQLGEVSVLAFSHSQNASPGGMFISLIGGLDLRKTSPRDAKVMKAIWEGKRNGKIASNIVAEDIVSLLPRPLTEVRDYLGIRPPLAYKHALDVLNQTGNYSGQLSAA